MLMMPPPLWALPQGCVTPVGHTGASLFPKHTTSVNRGQPPSCSTPQPSMASFSLPGLEKFEGCYLHSRDYKNSQPFFGKRVVVVGIGNSGIDIAVELSHTAKQVCWESSQGWDPRGRDHHPLSPVGSPTSSTWHKHPVPSLWGWLLWSQ